MRKEADLDRLPQFRNGDESGWKLRLQIAVRAAGLGIWDWDLLTGAFVYSERARQIYGLAPDEEVTRQRLREIVHPEDVEMVASQAQRALDPATREQSKYRYRILRADTGEERWIEAFGEAVFDESGHSAKAIRYIGTFQDVTEQVMAQNLVAAQEARLRLAIEASNVAVWEINLATGQVTHSPELNRLCGFPADATPSLEEYRSRYAPGERERIEKLGAELRARGETRIETEVRHLWPDGTEKWLSLRAQLAPGETRYDGRIIGVLADITEQKKRDQEQALLIRELSHRVKNSFAITQAIVSQSLRHGNVAPDVRKNLTDRLQTMAVAHDEIAKGGWERSSLMAILRRVCNAFGNDWVARITVRGNDVELSPRAALSFSLLVHELLTNAVKYGALGSEDGDVDVEVTRYLDAEGAHIELTWIERVGPQQSLKKPDTSSGFGTRLMDMVMAGFGGEIHRSYNSDGLTCRIRMPYASVIDA